MPDNGSWGYAPYFTCPKSWGGADAWDRLHGDLVEFVAWFHDGAARLAYLERLQWPDEFVCPRCGGPRAWHRSAQRWMGRS